MKKIYLIFLLSSCFILFFISIFNHRNKISVFKENINNLDKLVDDSIKPHCSFDLNEFSNNPGNKFKELIINIPESRKWSRNLLAAYIDSKVIKKKYKKRYDANIALSKSNIEICKLKARVRISGDWKDHIQSKNGDIISSLDVSLSEGNISGITKFKLFIPSTRNNSSEVILSLLLKEMGYLSPRTGIVKVNLNNKNLIMIFQEKATKELLEHNKLRESAILESNEALLWEIRSKDKNGISSDELIFPRVINKKWIQRNRINQKIGLEGSKKFAKAMLESWNSGITFSDIILSNENVKNKRKLSQYRAHLISSGSSHALINHNRRFYYDPVNESLLPIYYDGDSNIRNLKKLIYEKDIKHTFLTRDIETEDFNQAINQINKINLSEFTLKLNLAGVKINESELKKIKVKLIKNLISLREGNQTNLEPQFKKNPLIRKNQNTDYGLVLYANSNNNFYLCNIKGDRCDKKDLNSLELNKVLSGDYTKDKIKYYFIGDKFDPLTKSYNIEISKKSNLINPDKNIYIKKLGEPDLIFNKKKKLLLIKIKDFNDKVLFLDSKLDGWNIKVLANDIKNYKKIESRIDTNLLTSLLTIKDSYLKNLNIYIEGGKHEDSLNIINTSGSINSITIKNSFQDAIDFDFSNLKVNEIYVENSGNDCVDTSSGEYFVSKLVLYGCEDKGVSVGEKSYFKLTNAEIKETNMALVSKDSSKLIVKNGFLQNNNICAAAYNKKQEFGPSFISIPRKLCPVNKLAIQNISTLEVK